MKNENKENLGSAVTCWIPKSLLAWIDAQRTEGETRSSTIKRILRASWNFSETFSRVSPAEYLPDVPKNSSPVLLEGDAHNLMVEEKTRKDFEHTKNDDDEFFRGSLLFWRED